MRKKYSRLNKVVIESLETDYKSGFSLRKLSNKYLLLTSTIYYQLSKRRIMRKHVCANRANKCDDVLLGVFIGLWIGDGSKFRERSGKCVVKIHIDKRNEQLIDFIKKILNSLFGVNAHLNLSGKNSASVRIYSKFIYNYIDNYVSYEYKNKTKSIDLIKEDKSKEFIKGVLLGLTLSDGYIKKRFVYTTISKKLAKTVENILRDFNYSVYKYVRDQSDKGWQDVISLTLTVKDTADLRRILNDALSELGVSIDVQVLKQPLNNSNFSCTKSL